MAAPGAGRIARARRVCFFAHYHHLGLAAPHVLFYLDALRAAGFEVVVLSTATMAKGEAERLSAHCSELVLRANTGLDFGGWAEALARYPDLSAELLLLANDSVYGPLGDLSAFVDRLTATPADFYGAVESDSFGAHLQSWSLLLRPAAYWSAAFRDLMARPVDPALSKAAIVASREVALTRVLTAAGLTCHAAFRQGRAAGPIARVFGYNPTHLLWRELVERFDVPFVKVELLRLNPMRVRGLAAAPALIAARAPVLAPMVADDLARRAAPHERPALRARIEGWRDGRRRSYWPETQAALRRDVRLRAGGAGRLANAALFHLLSGGGTAAHLALHGALRLWDRTAGRRDRKGGAGSDTGARETA